MMKRDLGDPNRAKNMMKNLMSALIKYESIVTTQAKARAMKMSADKLISISKAPDMKRAYAKATKKVSEPEAVLPKLFNDLRQRYQNRNGSFTRVINLEPRISDSAPRSIIELVDGKREFKYWYLAKTVARLQLQGLQIDPITQKKVDDVLKFKPGGKQEFQKLVDRLKVECFSSESAKESLKTNFPSIHVFKATEQHRKLPKNAVFKPRRHAE